MNRKSNCLIVALIVILVLCLISLCLIALTGTAVLGYLGIKNNDVPQSQITSTPPVWPTEPSSSTDPFSTSVSIERAYESLEAINEEIVPINNPVDLAERLGGKRDVPSTLIDTDAPYEVGDRKSFWVSNTDTNDNFQVEAILRYRGENIYFWIEEGIRYNDADLQKLADTFDQDIIPTNREFFGMEWNPGVDGDPRFYVLYAGGLGDNLAGYYSSADEVHPDAHPYSNAHEMFLMNVDGVGLDEDYIYGTMAHEFQHMIHWYNDKNEETWLNEGASMLAEHVNGYDAGGFDYEYFLNTDLQLTDWGGDVGDNAPNYGASFLFMVYFLDRFGEDATKALVAHPENGFFSIDRVMEELEILNPSTGLPYTGNQVFADWSVSNYLQDPDVDGGRFTYTSYSPYRVSTTQTVTTCPADITRDVYQYGVNYIDIRCPGEHTLTFNGTPAVSLLPFEAPSSGDYFFWSNIGDESNPSLSRWFDLSSVSGSATLTFKTWYDLEEDYDYVFVSASTDEETWEILDSRYCTSSNPSGNSYGCGWNGLSDDWVSESIELSAYAGQKVKIRFDYVTDAAVNGKGMAIDDIRLEAINYASDLENDAGGWETDGFVRVQNALPQQYQLSVITIGSDSSVEFIPLGNNNTAEIQFSVGGDVERVVVVVSGASPITREKAIYQLQIR